MAQQLFTIQDDKIIINKLALRYLEGSIVHAGSFDIAGNTIIQSNLTVKGEITVDTINVKNLNTEDSKLGEVGKWASNTENELEGKGFSWTWGTGSAYISYQLGKKLQTNASIDLDAKSSYMIDNVEVLSLTELAPQVSKSKLKEVGNLKSLTVIGDSNLGEVAYINSSLGRIGINTDKPNGSLSIVSNSVEVVVDAPNYGIANIGTYSNHDVNFITDNTPRISIKNNGDIVFGNHITKSAFVTVYGTLKVDNLVSDTRIDRYSSLEFNSSREQSIYGLGLLWKDGESTKRFVLRNDPERIASSVSIDVLAGNGYYINKNLVLSEHELGQYVTKSNLKVLGALEELRVEGDTRFSGNVIGSTSRFDLITCGDMSISNNLIDTLNQLSIKVSTDEVFYADSREISIGNKLNTRRSVKVFGSLAIGVSTPDETVQLEVAGDVKFNNKKFITGISIPTEGSFNMGDICWNQTPITGNVIGWVCVSSGNPGIWAPFGTIGNHVSRNNI